MERHRSGPDILAGAIFAGIGLIFVVASLDYELGTPLRMGPGYFPLVVGGILALLGLGVVAKGLLAGEDISWGAVPWRSVVMIVAALVFFGLTVRRAGFLPAVFVTALLTALASYRIKPLTAVAVAAGLTGLSTLIFVVGLQLRLPLFGPWLTF
ncbi:tripartite tricarboxylate transporter TctB family protein [Jiangella alkaliphila]|uniref:Tripartite tricarboxylate transporter TctB family protein n=1 Tax=Jiangella alkaliphila TaxID=419479 RepID=A0A1H2KYP9_9ACTN|nr:tripartite tricarboxylate transporter TctB family protein [Jiangella alkaliphila]SDU73426.1 Tripartite tricarboxylate transporter TctB family protein [Jiangella alkaliphila]